MSSEPSASEKAGQCGLRQPGGDDNAEDENHKKLPAHIESVRDGLLDFHHFLGLQAIMLALEDEEDDGDIIPLSAYKRDGMTESQQAREGEFMKSAQVLVKSAKSARSGEDWQRLIQVVMTGRVDSAYSSRYVDQIGTLDFG
jgi:hypothetical protein